MQKHDAYVHQYQRPNPTQNEDRVREKGLEVIRENS